MTNLEESQSTENYTPLLSEQINARNEENDINQMVDKGLVAHKEAGEFDYANELEIPEALLSKPPKISERMRQHIIAKFPENNFDENNPTTIIIQGTTIRAVRPLWLGEGKRRTSYGREFKYSTSLSSKRDEPKKGIFELVGNASIK